MTTQPTDAEIAAALPESLCRGGQARSRLDRQSQRHLDSGKTGARTWLLFTDADTIHEADICAGRSMRRKAQGGHLSYSPGRLCMAFGNGH